MCFGNLAVEGQGTGEKSSGALMDGSSCRISTHTRASTFAGFRGRRNIREECVGRVISECRNRECRGSGSKGDRESVGEGMCVDSCGHVGLGIRPCR